MRAYIDDLIEVKHAMEKSGICALDKFMAPDADRFERVAAQLIANGYTPEVCEDVLCRLLNASAMSSEQYLKCAVFSDFLLAVQAKPIGVQELKICLLSYLGVDYMDRIE